MSLSGKEILWLEWRNMTYFDLQGFSIQQWRRISSECEYGSNLGPRSLMWRICSRSLTLKIAAISSFMDTLHSDWLLLHHLPWRLTFHGTVWSKPWLFFHLPSTPLNSFQTSLCVCDNVLKLHLINGVVLLYQIYVGGKDSVPKNKGKSHLQLDMIMNSCALVAESKQGWRCRAYWDGHNWSSICGQGLHLHQQSEKFMMRGYIIPMSNVLEKDKKKIGTGSS